MDHGLVSQVQNVYSFKHIVQNQTNMYCKVKRMYHMVQDMIFGAYQTPNSYKVMNFHIFKINRIILGNTKYIIFNVCTKVIFILNSQRNNILHSHDKIKRSWHEAHTQKNARINTKIMHIQTQYATYLRTHMIISNIRNCAHCACSQKRYENSPLARSYCQFSSKTSQHKGIPTYSSLLSSLKNTGGGQRMAKTSHCHGDPLVEDPS